MCLCSAQVFGGDKSVLLLLFPASMNMYPMMLPSLMESIGIVRLTGGVRGQGVQCGNALGRQQWHYVLLIWRRALVASPGARPGFAPAWARVCSAQFSSVSSVIRRPTCEGACRSWEVTLPKQLKKGPLRAEICRHINSQAGGGGSASARVVDNRCCGPP